VGALLQESVLKLIVVGSEAFQVPTSVRAAVKTGVFVLPPAPPQDQARTSTVKATNGWAMGLDMEAPLFAKSQQRNAAGSDILKMINRS